MREILSVLESDARATPERIAALTGIAEDEVRAAIAAWEAEGVIRRYKTVIDRDRLGEHRVTAFVDVTVAPERGRGFDDIAERIARFREIQAVHLVSGAQDLRVEVEGSSMKEVADFVAQKLSGVERVTATSTHFLLRRYKDDGEMLTEPEPDQRGEHRDDAPQVRHGPTLSGPGDRAVNACAGSVRPSRCERCVDAGVRRQDRHTLVAATRRGGRQDPGSWSDRSAERRACSGDADLTGTTWPPAPASWARGTFGRNASIRAPGVVQPRHDRCLGDDRPRIRPGSSPRR